MRIKARTITGFFAPSISRYDFDEVSAYSIKKMVNMKRYHEYLVYWRVVLTV